MPLESQAISPIESDAIDDLQTYLENKDDTNFFVEGRPLEALKTLTYSSNSTLKHTASFYFFKISNDVGAISPEAFEPLLYLLQSSDLTVQANAVGCMGKLTTSHDDNITLIAESPALDLLIDIVDSYEDGEPTIAQLNASAVLQNMTQNDEHIRYLFDAVAIPVLFNKIECSNRAMKYNCTISLTNIAGDDTHRPALIDSYPDIMAHLVSLMDSSVDVVPLILNLTLETTQILEFVRNGGLLKLLNIFNSSDVTPFTLTAVKCLHNVVFKREIHPQVVEMGFLNILIGYLEFEFHKSNNNDNDTTQEEYMQKKKQNINLERLLKMQIFGTLDVLASSSRTNRLSIVSTGLIERLFINSNGDLVSRLDPHVQAKMMALAMRLSNEIKERYLMKDVLDVLIPLATKFRHPMAKADTAMTIHNIFVSIGNKRERRNNNINNNNMEEYETFNQAWQEPYGGIQGYLVRFLQSPMKLLRNVSLVTLLKFLDKKHREASGGSSALASLIRESKEIVALVSQIARAEHGPERDGLGPSPSSSSSLSSLCTEKIGNGASSNSLGHEVENATKVLRLLVGQESSIRRSKNKIERNQTKLVK